MNLQYTHPLSKENRKKWLTLHFYRYIPLQKYTVPKNETLRYKLVFARPQCLLGQEGQRSGHVLALPS